MTFSLPLRRSLPLLLGALCAVITVTSVVHAWISLSATSRELAVRRMTALGQTVVRRLERDFGAGDLGSVQDEIAGIGVTPDVVLAVVLDHTNRVVAAMEPGWVDRNAGEVPLGIPAVTLERARAQMAAELIASAGNGPLRSVFPFRLGLKPGELVSRETGLLCLEFSQGQRQHQLFRVVVDEASFTGLLVLVTCGGVWWVLRNSITRRMERLVAATAAIAAGKNPDLSGLGGRDELSELALALGRMDGELRAERKALAESAARLRAIVAAEPECVKLVGPAGELLEMNPAGLALIEADSLASVAGHCVYDLIAPEHVDSFRELNRRVFDGQPGTLVFELNGRRGTRRWLETHAVPLRDSSGRVIALLAVTRDVSQRRQMESSLRASEERYSLVNEVTSDVIWDQDLGTGRIWWSPHFESQYGYRANGETWDGDFWRERIHPLDRERVVLSVRIALEGNAERWRDEYRFRHADGSYRHVRDQAKIVRDPRGSPVRLLGAMQDVTQVMRALEAVCASEARLQAIVHSTPNVAVQLYDQEGRVRLWNEASTAMFGWAEAEALGKTLAQLIFTPEQADEFLGLLLEIRRTGQPKGPMEFPFRGRSGAVGRCFSTVCEIPGDDGEPLFVCMDVDVTERHRIEQQLRNSREQFQRLFVESPLPTILFSTETGLITDVNRKFMELTGYTREETLGRNGLELGLWANLTDRARLLGPLADGREVKALEVMIRSKDGRISTMLLSAQLVDVGTDRMAMVQATDLTELRRAEAALRAKDQLLRQVIDLVPVFVFAKDLNSRFLFVNRTAAVASGRTPEEMVGRNGLELGRPAPEVERFMADDREVISSGRAKEIPEEAFTDSTGRVRIHHTIKIPFVNPATGQPAVLGVAMDVTDRKETELALRASEERFRTLVESSPVAVLKVDDAGIITFANRRALELFGYGKAELEGAPVEQLVPAAHRPAHVGYRVAFNQSPKARPIGEGRELFGVRKDGSKVAVEIGLSPISEGGRRFVLATVTDITERLRAEAALRTEADFRSAVIERMAEGLCVCHEVAAEPFVEFTVWNSAMIEITGYTLAEINRLGWYQTLYPDPEVRERAISRMARMRVGDDLQAEEWTITRADGQARCLAISTRVVHGPQGQAFVLAVMQDVTERKRAEAERASFEGHLRQVQKLEAIGTLAGGIAHDFNNILGSILGNAQLGLMDVPESHPARTSLEDIRTAALRAKELVQQILIFSRLQVRPELREPVDARLVLGEAIRLLKATIPAGVLVESHLGADPFPVLADPTQLHQILLNLGTNAWHAMEATGGRIVIGAEGVEVGGEGRSVPGLAPGPHLCLRVTDSGVGMDAQTQKRIFEPFYTTKDPGKGTGLGLSVVHGIVVQLKGAIRVESEVGQGSTFEVFLPLAKAAGAPGLDDRSPKAVGSAPRSLRILVLDDDEALQAVTCKVLERIGHRVTGETVVERALERFQADPGAFDLIITDQNMPGRSGVDLAAEFLGLRPDLPVLLVTGKLSHELRQRARDTGVREVLQKPLDLDELVAAIGRLTSV